MDGFPIRTSAGLAIRLPLLKIPEVKGLYAGFLAYTKDKDRISSTILLRTTTKTPAGYFWRTNSNEGPIEHSKRRWFPTSSREAIDANDVYIMPRFSSVSGDNIETSWSRVDIAKIQHKNATRLHFPKTLPYSRNRNFCGHAAVLQKLRDAFVPADRNLRSQDRGTTSYTISGLAGIGKTQVALGFSYYCIENHLFDAVIWINAQTSQSIHDGFQRTASELKLTEQGSPSDTIVREVLRWLSNFDQHANVLSGRSAHSAKWLLVFDNVEDVSLLHHFWLSNGPGCVLVTSIDPNLWFTLGSENIVLETLTIQESSELFRNLTRKEWDFTTLSKRLGGLPLAISSAARSIVQIGLSLEEFLRMWDKMNAETAQDYKDSLGIVWPLCELSPSSRGILQVISFLDPYFIQDSILVPSRTVALKEFSQNESDLLRSRSQLLQLALIMRSSERGGLHVHRLVQAAGRERMNPNEFQKAWSTTVALVSSAWIDTNSSEQGRLPNPKIRDDLLRHVVNLKGFATEMMDSEGDIYTNTDFAKLLNYAEEQGFLNYVLFAYI